MKASNAGICNCKRKKESVILIWWSQGQEKEEQGEGEDEGGRGYLGHHKVVEVVELVAGLEAETVDYVLQQLGHQDQTSLRPEPDLAYNNNNNNRALLSVFSQPRNRKAGEG